MRGQRHGRWAGHNAWPDSPRDRGPEVETEVREGLVGFGHAVNFVTLFHGAATAFRGLEQLVGQAQGHGLLTALASGLLEPAHGQREATHRAHFNGHLVVGAAYTARLDLDHGLDVVDGLIEQLERILARLLFDLLERAIDDALGDCFLAAFHDHVHEFGQLDIAVLGIRQDFTFGDFATTWHVVTSVASVGALSEHRESHRTLTYSTHAGVRLGSLRFKQSA